MSRGPRSAWGGVAGPAALISAWVVGGAMRDGYSPVNEAVSRLAEVGESSRSLMTAGFLGFAVAVPVYATALRSAVPGRAWQAAISAGLATGAAAVFPLGHSPAIDTVHGGLAILAYTSLAATPLLAARPLAASGRGPAAIASVAAGVACGLCLAASGSGPAGGLLQRAGLTIGDAWLVSSAAWILCGGRATPTSPAAPGVGGGRRR